MHIKEKFQSLSSEVNGVQWELRNNDWVFGMSKGRSFDECFFAILMNGCLLNILRTILSFRSFPTNTKFQLLCNLIWDNLSQHTKRCREWKLMSFSSLLAKWKKLKFRVLNALLVSCITPSGLTRCSQDASSLWDDENICDFMTSNHKVLLRRPNSWEHCLKKYCRFLGHFTNIKFT